MNSSDPFSAEIADPFDLFQSWMEAAKKSEINDPNAMSLATATPDGIPSVRIVLLKRGRPGGFTFYTHRTGRKGRELIANSAAALCFHWKSLQRQVRIEGRVSEVDPAEADAYFASRARESQIGAWASQQSQPLDSRDTLEARTRGYEAKFPDAVPRPPWWTGFMVTPSSIEFWEEKPFRLHDRIVFLRDGDGWMRQRLYP
jgi:pyridoxamine 5'-phosphate oxidase